MEDWGQFIEINEDYTYEYVKESNQQIQRKLQANRHKYNHLHFAGASSQLPPRPPVAQPTTTNFIPSNRMFPILDY